MTIDGGQYGMYKVTVAKLLKLGIDIENGTDRQIASQLRGLSNNPYIDRKLFKAIVYMTKRVIDFRNNMQSRN